VEREPELGAWLKRVQAQTERALEQALKLEDEQGLDAGWDRALECMRRYSLRTSKRLRPGLVLMGHAFARGDTRVPAGLWRFAAGTELLHTFMLVHDDVADRADLRRGELTLHRMLGPGKLGEDLAIIAGDHLFSRSLEVMLSCGLRGSVAAVTYFLQVCRYTAAGQYLDLQLPSQPLEQVNLSQTLRVAWLKTALYGFSAPLVCGALLGGGDSGLVAMLERLGRHIGIAYQLRDDLIGLFGQSSVAGKSVHSDLVDGKRTFPLLAAWLRAPEEVRRELELLWTPGLKNDVMLERARELVAIHGGRAATERVIERSTRLAEHILANLPPAGGLRELLGKLLYKLMHRNS
jgi:geranylgeranyl diphosphate synthase type I